MTEKPHRNGIISSIVAGFLDSKLSIILIIIAICLGTAALMITPREEEPQIVVPMADIFVRAPGSTPQEIEKLVATPLERLLWQIDGVEYVYSISRTDMAVVTVRFFVGEEQENSLVKLHNQIQMNIDKAAPIIEGWVVKPVQIDDVSIVNFTLYSDRYSDYEIRRVGEELSARLSSLENLSGTRIYGGRQRELRVELSMEKMKLSGVSLMEVGHTLKNADASVHAGSFDRNDRNFQVSLNSFLSTPREVGALVVGVKNNRPVYLRDIAEIKDTPETADTYTRISYSNRHADENKDVTAGAKYPAVTLAVAKKKGTNAVDVARNVIREFQVLEKKIIPDGISYEITRNYGKTAQEKVNGLLSSLLFAVISVVILLAFTLGYREAGVVALAVPISFSLALFVNYLLGYTINRVTLFALILSLGLVVDDPITNVENIQRHIRDRVGNTGMFRATLNAVEEVLPPVMMSTLAIIVCFIPLFFITGMMGPYMAPMAANVPLTVTFSTLCALTIVPWITYTLLKRSSDPAQNQGGPREGAPSIEQRRLYKVYSAVVSPFLESGFKRFLLAAVIIILLAASCSLAFFRLVPLKLLPFDNKNEFQVVIDMPEGTTLERTDAVVRSFEDYLKTVPEVTQTVSYTGFASPMDFNGMVRHYYLREGPNFADIRVNLAEKSEREQQSHAIVLRIRKDLMEMASEHNAEIKLVEVPPGPPVLSTIVGEIYGEDHLAYTKLLDASGHLKSIMKEEPMVVDIDDMAETEHEKYRFIIDKEKAALHGISAGVVTGTLRGVLEGNKAATLHLPDERQPLEIRITVPRKEKSSITALKSIPLKSADGRMIPLAELAEVKKIKNLQPIYHKNLDRVVYTLAEAAGRAPGTAVIDMMGRLNSNPVPQGTRVEWAGEGEWKITLRVFRDMGIGFAAAMVGIYILLVIQSGSFFMPVLIMMAIPLTLLGIMPGFMLLNTVAAPPSGGFPNPIFFTATSMIGMIALGGIVIRNSLVLIEFIQDSLERGEAMKNAILKSGAIRMRPIVLTALTTGIGAFPITFDPVFSGLAWALIFGLLASTFFTLIVIPVTYFAVYGKEERK